MVLPQCAGPWKNHGQFVSAVAMAAEDSRRRNNHRSGEGPHSGTGRSIELRQAVGCELRPSGLAYRSPVMPRLRLPAADPLVVDVAVAMFAIDVSACQPV